MRQEMHKEMYRDMLSQLMKKMQKGMVKGEKPEDNDSDETKSQNLSGEDNADGGDRKAAFSSISGIDESEILDGGDEATIPQSEFQTPEELRDYLKPKKKAPRKEGVSVVGMSASKSPMKKGKKY